VKTQTGFHGLPAKRYLIAPDNDEMAGLDRGERSFDGIAHPQGHFLNHNVVSSWNKPFELRPDFPRSVGRKHKNKPAAVGFQKIEQPFDQEAAGYRIQDLRAVRSQAGPAPGSRYDRRPLGSVDR